MQYRHAQVSLPLVGGAFAPARCIACFPNGATRRGAASSAKRRIAAPIALREDSDAKTAMDWAVPRGEVVS